MYIKYLYSGSLFLLLTNNAHAYLDPGSFSVIFQAIVAGVAAVIGYSALFWHKVKSQIISILKFLKIKK